MGRRSTGLFALLVGLVLLLAACGRGEEVLAFPDLLDPTEAEVSLPDGYRLSLPRDALSPVYNPEFISADEAIYQDEGLVIGVNFGGEARAYPVGLLSFREIVVDTHAGIPTLVTW